MGCDAEENGGGILPARGVADPDVVLKERSAEFKAYYEKQYGPTSSRA